MIIVTLNKAQEVTLHTTSAVLVNYVVQNSTKQVIKVNRAEPIQVNEHIANIVSSKLLKEWRHMVAQGTCLIGFKEYRKNQDISDDIDFEKLMQSAPIKDCPLCPFNHVFGKEYADHDECEEECMDDNPRCYEACGKESRRPKKKFVPGKDEDDTEF